MTIDYSAAPAATSSPSSAAASPAPLAPVVPRTGALSPLGIDRVRITGGFWGERQVLNARTIIPHIRGWEERTGWIGNFDAVADGTIATTRTGREFSDSEVYKLLEAMAWEIGRTGDAELEQSLRQIAERVGRAQDPDGYLNTRFGHAGQQPRYSALEWGHELYCYGHLFQAAVARLRTGRRDRLVEIALKAADHVCRMFGDDGLQKVCGHPEIEVALVELSRATGEERYLHQANLFLTRRGHQVLADIELGRAYYQDDMPIADATVLRGHAVRALYLTAGAVDDSVERGDDELLETLRRQYSTTLHRRTYLTGGMGSHHQGEDFGADFELPPDRAYCETCAGVASVMVAWRLLLATGDLSYADVIERTLYNIVATAVAETGDRFFYTNPLQQRELTEATPDDELSPRAEAQQRAPWFEVSCCPPNLARTFAQLSAYVATTSATGLQLLQYAPAAIDARSPRGEAVRVTVDTAYPLDGDVTIDVEQWPEHPFELTLRVPAWARGAVVEVHDASTGEVHGVAAETREANAPAIVLTGIRSGSRVVLHLPVEARFTAPDARIDAVRGTLAVERGPLVLCLESVDLPDGLTTDDVRVDAATAPVTTPDGARVSVRSLAEVAEVWPYTSSAVGAGADDPAEASAGGAASTSAERAAVPVDLIPYHRWANRGPSTMRVWIPA